MASLKDATLAVLNGDTNLTDVFTGGFVTVGDLPKRQMTWDTVLKEADGVTIKPTGGLRWRGPYPMRGPDNAAMWYVDIFLYDDPTRDRDNIDYAKRRIWDLLHDRYMGDTDNEGLAWFIWLGDLGELPDGADQDDVLTANMDRTRFQITITRK